MSATATLVVDFGTTIDATLKAELYDVLNKDKTSFRMTDSVFFVTFSSENVIVSTPVPTDGDIIDRGFVYIEETEVLSFASELNASLSYPPYGAVTLERWYGREGIDFSIDGESAYISSGTPCICKVHYKTKAHIWELKPPISIRNESEYQIMVYITGVVI